MKANIVQVEHLSLEQPQERFSDDNLQNTLVKTGSFRGSDSCANQEKMRNRLTKNAAISDHWASFMFMLNPAFEPMAKVSLGQAQQFICGLSKDGNLRQYLRRSSLGSLHCAASKVQKLMQSQLDCLRA